MTLDEYVETHSFIEYLELVRSTLSKEDGNIYGNKEIFYDLLLFMYANITDFYREVLLKKLDTYYVFDSSKFTRRELKNLIDEFYRVHNIDFKVSDVKDYLNIYTKKDIRTSPLDSFEDGSVTFINNKININVGFNGHISDSIPWIHEISHFRNEIYGEQNDLFIMLSEGLSFANEFIYGSFLEEKGYKKDVLSYRVRSFSGMYEELKSAIHTLRILILYIEEHELNEKKFKEYFEDNTNFYQSLYTFKYYHENDPRLITTSLHHSMGYLLAMYMYMNYKNDKKYMSVIEEFNEKSKYSTIDESLNIIGINRNDPEIIDKLGLGILSFINELEGSIKEDILIRKK